MSAATASARLSSRSERAQLRPALRYDPVLLGVVLLLTTFGVVMVYSSSAVFAAEKRAVAVAALTLHPRRPGRSVGRGP